jgi:hypothetical protein
MKSYFQRILSISLFLTGVFSIGCLPSNLAKNGGDESNQTAANAAKKETAQASTAFGETNNDLIETAPTPKPAAKQTAGNAVCPDPKKPCHHREKQFEDWQLSFQMPAKIIANKTYKSAPFYALILKKYPEGCNPDEMDADTAVEAERVQIQKKLPTRKVFAEYDCPNMDAVGYDFEGKMDAEGERFLISQYIAVYAGETEDEADTLLDEISKQFPEAEIKKMTAHWERIEQ